MTKGTREGGSRQGVDDALVVDDSAKTVCVTWDDDATVVVDKDRFAAPGSSSPSTAPEPVSVAMPEATGFDDQGEIARGGMGTVHVVVDRRLQRQMAMKSFSGSGKLDTPGARRFVEEAQITGQLDHPNITPVHELGRDDSGTLYFTMKLVRGKTLEQLLEQLEDRRLEAGNLERLVQILLKVSDGLEFAHSRGVIHRDLKPANLMVGSYGQAYVVDWGLAYLRDGPRLVCDEGDVLGTPSYMAPEQAQGKDVDERTDVYGLGGVLYTVLTGAKPHTGEGLLETLYAVIHEDVVEPQELVGDAPLPPELCRIALKALARDPEHRHPNVAALRADLERFLRGGGWLATRSFTAGEHLIREGESAAEAYIITTGSCEAYKMIDGERQILRRMGVGEVVGETALLTGKPRTASVVAHEPVTARVVTRDALERELEHNDWMRALFHGLAERFRDLDQQVTRQRRGGSA